MKRRVPRAPKIPVAPPENRPILDRIEPFLAERGITSETGPVAARDQHGHEYETLLVPFNGSDGVGVRQYEKSLDAFLSAHSHVIWRFCPQIESSSGGGQRVYSRLSRYAVRP